MKIIKTEKGEVLKIDAQNIVIDKETDLSQYIAQLNAKLENLDTILETVSEIEQTIDEINN